MDETIGHAYTCENCDHHFILPIYEDCDCEECGGPVIYDGEEEMPEDE